MGNPDLTGQIGLVYGPTTWSGRTVSWVTDSPVFHSVIAINNRWCVSAEHPRARYRPINGYPRIIWSNFDHTAQQRTGIALWARHHVNASYNLIDDIAIGLERLLDEHTPKSILRRLSSSQHMECAQLCDAAYTYGGGYQLFRDHRYFGAVAPSDFVPLWQDAGWWPTQVATTYRRHFTQHSRHA
jgi:hypothetical protein